MAVRSTIFSHLFSNLRNQLDCNAKGKSSVDGVGHQLNCEALYSLVNAG